MRKAPIEAKSESGAVANAHTPGPWRLDGLYVWGNTGRALATVHWCSGHDDEVANAHLIAAAPHLLRELRDSRCPGGGWNGMPADLEPTVGACVDHEVCGCSAGWAVAVAEGKAS